VTEAEPGLFTLADDPVARVNRPEVAPTWWWVFLGGLGQ
jgi:hypothetical protein